MTCRLRWSTARSSVRSQNRPVPTVIGIPSRCSNLSVNENAVDVDPTVSISNHSPGISPRSRMAAVVAFSPLGNEVGLGVQSPWALLQSDPAAPLWYQPASMTR